MAAAPRQGDLFNQPAAGTSDQQEASLTLTADQLRSWQERVHRLQAPLFKATAPVDSQGSLFGAASAPADHIQPLSLNPLPLSFWRWPESPHQGAAL